MQFRVAIPEHVKAGQTIRIRCPDGSEGDVKVPKGLKGGDTFIFEMPKLSNKTTISSSAPSSLKRQGSAVDLEIASLHDFLIALVVGVGIGLSIVTGFILGVLFVTDAEETEASVSS